MRGIPDPDENTQKIDFRKRIIERTSKPRLRGDGKVLSDEEVEIEGRDLARRQLMLQSLNKPISITELRDYLSTIARRKSPGVDGVTNEFLIS